MSDPIPTPKDVAESTGQAPAQAATGTESQDPAPTPAATPSTEGETAAAAEPEGTSTDEPGSDPDGTSEEEPAAGKDGGADELKQWKSEARKHERRAKENLTRAEKAEAEVARLTAAGQTETLRNRIAKEKDVPANLLRGETEEEIEEFAAALQTFVGSSKPRTGPIVPEAGTGTEAGPIDSEAEAALKQLGFA